MRRLSSSVSYDIPDLTLPPDQPIINDPHREPTRWWD